MIAQVIAPLGPKEKAWVTFQACAALAGYTATKNAAGWIVVGRYGHTTSFYTLTTAESWLDRVMAGGPHRE